MKENKNYAKKNSQVKNKRKLKRKMKMMDVPIIIIPSVNFMAPGLN